MDFRNLVDNVLTHGMNTFGEKVKFFPKCGGVYEVQAVFDVDFQVVDAQTEQLVSANQPALGVNLNAISWDLQKEDEVEIRGARYRVHEKREDGQGGAVLLLHALRIVNANRDTRASKT